MSVYVLVRYLLKQMGIHVITVYVTVKSMQYIDYQVGMPSTLYQIHIQHYPNPSLFVCLSIYLSV